MKWKHFPRNWPFVRGIHRSPVNSPHKGQWRGALMFSLICVWINDWVNNREAGDLRRYRTHYDVIVMDFRCHDCHVASLYRYNQSDIFYCLFLLLTDRHIEWKFTADVPIKYLWTLRVPVNIVKNWMCANVILTTVMDFHCPYQCTNVSANSLAPGRYGSNFKVRYSNTLNRRVACALTLIQRHNFSQIYCAVLGISTSDYVSCVPGESYFLSSLQSCSDVFSCSHAIIVY